jgi:hypothetical protein
MAMADISKDQRAWKHVKAVAAERLSGLDGALDWSPHAHEVLRWEHPKLTLIFYPHRTSAGNYHIRVRAGRCTHRGLLRECIIALAENSCQFQFPTERAFHDEGLRVAVKEGRRFTQ